MSTRWCCLTKGWPLNMSLLPPMTSVSQCEGDKQWWPRRHIRIWTLQWRSTYYVVPGTGRRFHVVSQWHIVTGYVTRWNQEIATEILSWSSGYQGCSGLHFKTRQQGHHCTDSVVQDTPATQMLQGPARNSIILKYRQKAKKIYTIISSIMFGILTEPS